MSCQVTEWDYLRELREEISSLRSDAAKLERERASMQADVREGFYSLELAVGRMRVLYFLWTLVLTILHILIGLR